MCLGRSGYALNISANKIITVGSGIDPSCPPSFFMYEFTEISLSCSRFLRSCTHIKWGGKIQCHISPATKGIKGINKILWINKIFTCQPILGTQPHSYGEDKLKCSSFNLSKRFLLRLSLYNRGEPKELCLLLPWLSRCLKTIMLQSLSCVLELKDSFFVSLFLGLNNKMLIEMISVMRNSLRIFPPLWCDTVSPGKAVQEKANREGSFRDGTKDSL